MLTALTFIAVLYLPFLLFLTKGWKIALLIRSDTPPAQYPDVTVVVAARNEEDNIAVLLDDLKCQTTRNFQVVVVDDHSEDKTVTIAKAFHDNPTYSLDVVSMDAAGGKKAAITTGIRRARGSVVITTDADCRPGRRWIESMLASFHPHVKFVSGGVRIGPAETLRAHLQSLEFSSLVGTGASTIGLGWPTMCNGANMAFRRDAFIEVGGYSGNDHIASGDDVFLMQKIHARYPGSVVFCPQTSAVVETGPVAWRDFIDQRIRWGAKWKYAATAATPTLAWFVGLFHLSWLVLVPATVLNGAVIEPLLLFLVKAIFEMAYLRKVHRFLGAKWSWRAFALLQLTYSAYVVTMGALANFKTPAWKGRKIRRTAVEIHSSLADNR